MTFARELDDLPWEARLGAASTFTFWPKVDGVNVEAAGLPYVTLFSVYSPEGDLIETSTPTIATAGTPSHSSLSCALQAISTLGEGYQLRITWRVNGESVDRFDMRTFDVVRYPFGGPRTSLNDMLEERPDCGFVLDRLGQILGQTEGAVAQGYAAGVVAMRARVELEAMIRAAMLSPAASGESLSAAPGQSSGASYLRPRLILDRTKFDRTERLLAMALLYESIADNPIDGDGPNDKPAIFYRSRAEAAFKLVGPLSYDRSEDLVADEVVSDVGRVTYHRRVQA